MLNWIEEKIRTAPEWADIRRFARRAGEESTIIGLHSGEKAAVLATLWRDLEGHLLVVAHSSGQAEILAGDLETWVGPENVLLFPAYELLPHEEAYEQEVAGRRLQTAGRILNEEHKLVITSWNALERKMLPPKLLVEHTLSLSLGDLMPREAFLARLVTLGYERTDRVEGMGQFSVRGDIIDVFPPDRECPLRLEFYGDEIDSIRDFDPESQRSNEKYKNVLVYPAREGVWFQEELVSAMAQIRQRINEQMEHLRKEGLEQEARQLQARMSELLERLAEGVPFPGSDRFLPLIQPKLCNFFDYFSSVTVIVDEPARGEEIFQIRSMENAKIFSGSLERGIVLPDEQGAIWDSERIKEKLYACSSLHFSVLSHPVKRSVTHRTLTLPLRIVTGFGGKSQLLHETLRRYQLDGFTIGLILHGEERREHLRRSLVEAGIAVHMGPATKEVKPGTAYIMEGSLTGGFDYPQGKVVLFTENELFGQTRKPRRIRMSQEGIKLTSFSDLKAGDYVVHIAHGIGRYLGLKTLEIAGALRDYLEVEYAGEDRLFVPTDQVHLLQKYVGVEDDAPRVHRLGGNDWQKVKNRVKESVQEMAEGLLALYAERSTVPGFEFSKDTLWQQDFEEAFVYEETRDQLKAVQEIKGDMESSQPMDRLLCGDVGYGKTEVAMRAAFKAIMDGKQVAVLVPTTILAQQHFQTFSQRFSSYPVTIRVMSRFQTPREQEEAKDGLRDGSVDLVIGTHRLLSKDITFKDLGLLIVDEEQRFGVSHKERLKEMSKGVDVLTLTATPIPRTLHMSMVGIRDMSVIETPPEDRFPIRTYVMEFHEEVIREAIRRELDRGGQVYFVYNRVDTIERMARYIQTLVPEAQVSIGHGQMGEDALERVMFDFYQGESDILLCTTIIETGLDIPNVNTLIVYDADRFGLSQLYQLRGRVGRSNRVAHAYFTYRKDKIMGEVAEKRLAAIRDFTDLGSGFKIAMRDLEIRGAGNLLGPEQHGHIAAVGFELYCKLLEEAIRERKGERKIEMPEPTIELPVDALLPQEYIADAKQRVEMYKKIAAINNLEEVDHVEDEILDRFGDLPSAVRNLLNVARIKILAKQLGVSSLTPERQEMVAKLYPGISMDADKILSLLHKYKNLFRYQPGRIPTLRWKSTGRSWKDVLEMVLKSMMDLAAN